MLLNGSSRVSNNNDITDIELMSLTDASVIHSADRFASSNNDNTIQQSKQSSNRYMVIAFAVLVGCYHLGRWSCMIEHEDHFGLVSFKKPSLDKEKDALSTGKYALTMDKLQAIRKQGQQLLTELDEYYSKHKGGAQSILIGDGGWDNGWTFSNTSTSKEEKLIDTMARALLDPQQDVFTIGVIGSSVAAGHDNCRYDNYEEQLERTWSPIWEAAGMRLNIQNAGQGGSCGDSHKNQVWCVQQNVSPESDIVHYSWSYFEGNDGRNERESLVRWTQLLPRAPPVHVIDVGRENCLGGNPQEKELFQVYDAYGYNAFCMRYALVSSQLGPHVALFEGQHTGDGFHKTTRYGLNETNKKRRDSLGVVLRNWHPGPLGFQIISDALTYTYTTALLAALDRIEAVIDVKKPIKIKVVNASMPEAAWWKDRPIVMGTQLVKPLVCDPRYCQVDQAPKCLNLEVPTFGTWGASITPPDDDLNPFKGQLQKWNPFKKGGDDPWHMVNRLEASLYSDNPDFCKFPDHCAGVKATSPESGMVVFKLPKMEVGMVAICFCCSKDAAVDQVLNNKFVEVDFNDRILERTTWDLYPEKKCVRVINDHTGTSVGNTGHSYLSVRILEGNTQTVQISHVITL